MGRKQERGLGGVEISEVPKKKKLSITTLVDVFCTRSLLRHVISPTLLVHSSTATYLVNSHFIVSILKSSIRD